MYTIVVFGASGQWSDTARRTASGSTNILAIFYPSLKYIVGCLGLFLQAKKVDIYFAELAERVEYGNYDKEGAHRSEASVEAVEAV